MIALFGLALIGLSAFLLYRSNAFASIDPTLGSTPDLTQPPTNSLTGAIFSQDETDVIFRYAVQYDVDPRFLGAIRKAENGGPGREFGILSVPAPDLATQAQVAARTVANNILRFEGDTGLSPYDRVGRYTDAFIEYLGAKWAPVGASNDPGNLNQYWVSNVESYYRSIDYA